MISRWTLIARLLFRPLRAEPARTSLTLFAIALGVAVLLAIELAGVAAAGSFRSSVESLVGDAGLEVTSPGGVPDEVLTRLSVLPEPLVLHPRIEDYAVIESSRQTVPLIGIDLVAQALSGSFAATSAMSEDWNSETAAWVGDALGRKPGDTLRVWINDRAVDLRVRGVLQSTGSNAIVLDLAAVVQQLGAARKLDRILIQTPREGSIEQWESRVRAVLPAGVTLARAGARTEENRRMLAAFRWNLRVLSYIALVVGAFLIYNTIAISVVRRRHEIGIVRALGGSRGFILSAFLIEALVLGLAGSAVGVGLGRVLAEGAVQGVSATIESLYVSSQPAPVELTFEAALTAILIGLLVTLVSALAPALEASRVAPVEAMARGRAQADARVHQRRDLLLGILSAVAGVLACRPGPLDGKPLFGYLAAVCFLAASALSMPSLVSLVTMLTSRILGRWFGVEALLASRSLGASLKRTSVLAAALSTAIAMMAAVAIMVGSFRQTVLVWMDNQLQADLYLRPAGPAAADRHPSLSADIPDLLAALPSVAALDRFRAYSISYNGLPATLAGGETAVSRRFGRLRFTGSEQPNDVYRAMSEQGAAIVSEPFASKHNVRAGDTLRLSLAGQPVTLRVAGVYYDYANERGYIIVDRSMLMRYLPDPAPSNVAVYLKPGVPLERGRAEVERALAGRKVLLFSNRSLRAEAIRIFDRTFAITYALEAVAILVAVMGIAGALLALVIDRRRELSLLRFLGASRQQIRRLILAEAGLLGLLANVAGLVLGSVLSLLLIFVINKQSFGWTIQFHAPVAVLLGALSAVFAATVLAGLYPARMAVELNPIEVIHEE